MIELPSVHLQHRLTTYLSRVRLRPTEDQGIFSLMVGGKYADTAALAASRDALLKFVYEVTNRSPEELRFGEIRSMSEFR